MSAFVHIIPQLPPAIDGVGDYCWNLWKHWLEPELDWGFLVARGAEDTRAMFPEAPVNTFGLNAASLTEALERGSCRTAVLHYVGYAYQPKGIPVWLPRALRDWRYGAAAHKPSLLTGRRLVVMFHEMYARSSPLRSPFWVAPVARRIIRDLARISDTWVTSCERYFGQLSGEFGAQPNAGRIIPIPSNIPAPFKIDWPPSRGKLRIVVFGLAKTRIWALERHSKLLRALHQADLIEHVTLAGQEPLPEDERMWRHLAARIGSNVEWRTRFNLLAEDISAELVQHDVGLLANEPDVLTKSGVFAALAAHGVVPIVSTPAREPLPERFRPSVLANDDDRNIEQLVQLLREPSALNQRREHVRALAARELGWPGIARSWSEVLRVNVPAAALQTAEEHAAFGNRLEVPA